MNDYRLTDRLITYWNNINKNNTMPEFSRFNASAIHDLWQQCILFTVTPATSGGNPVVSFYQIGDQLKNIYGKDAVGKSFNPAQRHFQGAAVVRRVHEIFENPLPIKDQGQFVGENHKVVKYRSCLLPFGREGVVTHVIAGLSWREF